jgi:hypothetical protein
MSLLTELENFGGCGCCKDFAPPALWLTGSAADTNDRKFKFKRVLDTNLNAKETEIH